MPSDFLDQELKKAIFADIDKGCPEGSALTPADFAEHGRKYFLTLKRRCQQDKARSATSTHQSKIRERRVAVRHTTLRAAAVARLGVISSHSQLASLIPCCCRNEIVARRLLCCGMSTTRAFPSRLALQTSSSVPCSTNSWTTPCCSSPRTRTLCHPP